MTKSPSQLLRETMDAINGIQAAPVAAPVQALDPSRFDFVTEVANPNFDLSEDEPEEVEAGVNYTISGKYYPATFDSPAEYPDLDITAVVILATGQDVTSQLSTRESDRIERECFADAEQRADDGDSFIDSDNDLY